jgi:hypothetical protein
MFITRQRTPHGRYRVQSTAIGIIALLASASAGGCTSQGTYAIGQTFHNQACKKYFDQQEYGRCMAGATRSYDDYKRNVEAAKGKKWGAD